MFERWMMSQFDRLLRCVSASSVVFGDCPHVDMWCCCHHPNFKPSLHEFLLLEIMWYEMWAMSWHVLFVCMSIFTALEAWLFCKLVGIAFGLGCNNLRCAILELHLVCFPVFGSVDHFRDVSVRTADIERWELFILIAVYQLCLEGRLV